MEYVQQYANYQAIIDQQWPQFNSCRKPITADLPVFNSKREYIKYYEQKIGPVELILIGRYLSDQLQTATYNNQELYLLYNIIKRDFCDSQYNNLNLLINTFCLVESLAQKQQILDFALEKITLKYNHITFLFNILLNFGADPEIIPDEQISKLVNNRISPDLLGERGEKIKARHEEIKKNLQINLCDDVTGIIMSFVNHEYLAERKSNWCNVM